MHFKYVGLTHDVTGSFTLVVFKQDLSSIVLVGWYTINALLMHWDVTFIFFAGHPPLGYLKNW